MSYFAPTSLEDAFGHLAAGAAVVAGGTDWYPALGETPAPAAILDVTRLAGFRAITHGPLGPDTGAGWRIGAAATWTDLIRADLPPAFDGLKAAAREVGSVQIQNAGTIAGNLCNASPAADGAPPLLALDAMVELTSHAGARQLPLADFIAGPRRTRLEADELMSAILIPDPPEGAQSAFLKLGARRYLVISIAMVAVTAAVTAGRVSAARVAVGACSPVAARLPALEAALIGRAPGDGAPQVEADHLAPLAPITDIRASGAYRADAVAELCRRAVDQTFRALT